MNLTLGGVFIDQVEELDDGDAGERILDTPLGRLNDPPGPRKLLCVANPAGLPHWVYYRLVDEPTRDRDAAYLHVTSPTTPPTCRPTTSPRWRQHG